MAINYTKPDVEVLQDFQNITPLVNLATLQTVVVGPSYKKLKEFNDADSTSYKVGTYTRGERFEAKFPELPAGSKIDYDSLSISIKNYSGEHEIPKAVAKVSGNSGAITEIGDDYILFVDNNVDFNEAGVSYPVDELGAPVVEADNDADCVSFIHNSEYCYLEVQEVVDAHTLKLDNPDSVVTTTAEGIEYNCGNFGWSLDENDNIIISTRLSHNGSVYISGEALRTDYCDRLISVGSVDDLESIFGAGEVTLDNPLAYGMSKVLPYLGSAEVVAGLMVESDDVIGYQKAFEFLESQEVYCIVPLTNNPIVHQMLKEHVIAMSDVLEKRERIGLINSAKITRQVKSGFLGRKNSKGVYDFAQGNITNSGKELLDTVDSEYTEFKNIENDTPVTYTVTNAMERGVIIVKGYAEGDAVQYSTSDNPAVYKSATVNADGYAVIAQEGNKTIASIKFSPVANNSSAKDVYVHLFKTTKPMANSAYAYGITATSGSVLSNASITVPNNKKCIKIRAFNKGTVQRQGRSINGVTLPVVFTVSLEGDSVAQQISASGTFVFEKNISSITVANASGEGTATAPETVVDIMIMSNGGSYKLDSFSDEYASFLTDKVTPGEDQLVIINKNVVDPYTYSGYGETRYLISEVVEEDTLKVSKVYDEAEDQFVDSIFEAKNEEPLYYRVETPVINNKRELAQAYADMSASFGTRRIAHVFAPSVGVSDDGYTTTMVPGYYFACAVAGATQAYPPQRGFTNMSFAGFVKVSGTNDTFSESQMDIIASGGTMIVIQPNVTSALTVRHQLTTDMTSVETREYSVTKDVDYMAKMARNTFRPYIGKYVINDATLEMLYKLGGSLISKWLTDGTALTGTVVDKFAVDPDQSDRVYACFNIKVPLPLNYIRLIFII